MRNSYLIYIKSHTDAPDYEDQVTAKNRKEAIELFYMRLQGEFDRKFIDQNMAREYKHGGLERRKRKAEEDPLTLY